MQDNVHKCPRCNGTGEVRVSYHVNLRYQDCSDWYGPFNTREEAQVKCDELFASRARHGGMPSVVEQEEKP